MASKISKLIKKLRSATDKQSVINEIFNAGLSQAMQGQDLSMMNFVGIEFPRPWSFQDANLVGTKFTRCEVLGLGFMRANLINSSFFQADLFEAAFDYADLSNSSLQQAMLVFADLRGANLTGADVRGANFACANLRGANMTGVIADTKTKLPDETYWQNAKSWDRFTNPNHPSFWYPKNFWCKV